MASERKLIGRDDGSVVGGKSDRVIGRWSGTREEMVVDLDAGYRIDDHTWVVRAFTVVILLALVAVVVAGAGAAVSFLVGLW